jgi:hypothetical protein
MLLYLKCFHFHWYYVMADKHTSLAERLKYTNVVSFYFKNIEIIFSFMN